ncbi:MAG TPA: phosphoribosyltransferase family protein [Chitinophagaceae bacterium]|nr:phosphoribosyltransferase family protein [Chitinophagaceae bacterium]
MTVDTNILSAEAAQKKLQRMAFEILERNAGEKKIILAGIKDSGIIIANIIRSFLAEVFKGKISVIEIDIDKQNPKNVKLSSNEKLDDAVIVIADDVANSGRTLLYALKPFLEFYPKKIQTLVLVERSYKQFPVSPDYVGMSVSTAANEIIIVETKNGKVTGAGLA